MSASLSIKSAAAEKKPITSSDTVWQYYLNGCRHMPDSSGQLTEDLSISVHFTVHVTVPSVPVVLSNEQMRGKYSLLVWMGGGSQSFTLHCMLCLSNFFFVSLVLDDYKFIIH